VVTSLSMSIPMLINGFRQFNLSGPIEWISAWIAATKAKTAATEYDNMVTQLSLVFGNAKVKGDVANAAAEDMLTLSKLA